MSEVIELKHDLLMNNLDSIVQSIDFDKLINVLNMHRFRGIFPIYEPPFDNLTANDESKKRFVRYCLERNEKEFIGLLLHNGQYTAAHIIEPTTIDITDADRLDPNAGTVITQCHYLELNPNDDRLVTSEDKHSISNVFPMQRSPRGICLIINNYLTFGTFKETQRFRNIFYQLHFDVIVEKNLTAQQIMDKLSDLSEDPVLASHDAFACLIISHGTDKGEIIGFDEEELDMKEMCQTFDDVNCPHLKQKPRIFVFNCCRGEEDVEKEITTLALRRSESPQKIPQLPKILDFLICYSTLDGYAAYVDWDKGTQFGTVLCDSLVKRAWTRDMNNILINTNKELRDAQPFDWTQSFTQVLSFNPSHPFGKQLPPFL